MRPLRDELRTFAYKTCVVVGALTLSVGISYAATTIGTNIVTDGSLNVGSLFGVATSSPGSLFSVGGVTNFTTATSTFYSSGGVNLSGGCFAVNGTCVGDSSGSSEHTATVNVSSAELKSLSSSPKTIVAAPGLGKFIRLLSWRMIFHYGTAAYQNVDDPFFGYAGTVVGDGSSLVYATPYDLFTSANDAVMFGSDVLVLASNGNLVTDSFNRAQFENKAIVLADDQNWTTGDGTATIIATYEIDDLP
jgi:hypothetical protein